jgi:hypothetical protein
MTRIRVASASVASAAVVAGLVVALAAAPAAQAVPADTTYLGVVHASVLIAVADGGATVSCTYTDPVSAGYVDERLYSADLTRIYRVQTGLGPPNHVGGVFGSTLVHVMIPNRAVNAVDAAYQTAVAQAAAAHAHTGRPVWMTQPDPASAGSPVASDGNRLSSILQAVDWLGSTAVGTRVDATHWTLAGASSTVAVDTDGTAVTSLTLTGNGQPTSTFTCAVTYGPSGIPSFDATSLSRNQVMAVGLRTNLVEARSSLVRIRTDMTTYVAALRGRAVVSRAAVRFLADVRKRLGKNWTSVKVRLPAGYYVFAAKSAASSATVTWRIPRPWLRTHPGRAVTAIHVGAVTITSTSPLS